MKERLMHVQEAKKSLGTTIPWLADGIDNQFKHAMGDRPNSEFVIGPEGKIVRMRDWSNEQALRADLAELVGPVANPTNPRDLGLVAKFEKTKVARGVVERIQHDGRMTAFKVKTIQPKNVPPYVKLRAEGEGKGKLYLGFFVDPIYQVHWNNMGAPVQIDVNGNVHHGPKVEAKADADPREFIVDVDQGPVNITLTYLACDDKETWCNRFTQSFVVTQEADRDAGRVSGQRPGGGGGASSGGGRGRFGGRGGFGGGLGRGRPGFGARNGNERSGNERAGNERADKERAGKARSDDQ